MKEYESKCRDLYFHLLSFFVNDKPINDLLNGAGRRSVPNLKPTLIAICLPFAAAICGMAWAVDGASARGG